MNFVRVRITIALCAMLGVWSLGFGAAAAGYTPMNGALENYISKVWLALIDGVAKKSFNEGVGTARTVKDFIAPVVKEVFDENPSKIAGMDAKQAHEQLSYLVENAALELFKREPCDDVVKDFDDLLAIALDIDKALTDHPEQQKIIIHIFRDLIAEYESFTKSGDLASLKAAYEAKFKTLYDSYPDLNAELVDFNTALHMTIYKAMDAFSLEKFNVEKSREKKSEAISYLKNVAQRNVTLLTTLLDSYEKSDKSSAIMTKRLSDVRKLLFFEPKNLSWCGCKPASIRLALVMGVLNDAKTAYADKSKQLAYTSLGCGEFLQDYLQIAALKHLGGFLNIDVNIIDTGLKDAKAIHDLIDDTKIEEYLLDMALNSAFYLANFKNKIDANFIWTAATRKERPLYKEKGIYISMFTDAYNYIKFVKKHPEYKTDILIMVDPFGMTYDSFVAQGKGNMVAFVEKKGEVKIEKEEAIARTEAAPEEEETKKVAEPKSEEGMPGLEEDEPKADTLNKSIIKNPSVVLILSAKPGVESYTNIPAEKFESRFGTTINKVLTKIANSHSIRSLFNPSKKIFAELLEVSDMYWFSSIHVAFYDLVALTISDSARSVVYVLDALGVDEDANIMKINIPAYLNWMALTAYGVDELRNDFGFRPFRIESSKVAEEGVMSGVAVEAETKKKADQLKTGA